MKKIIFLILFIHTFLIAQESTGYILDGTYNTGKVAYGAYIDTNTFTYVTANVGQVIKFAITQSSDKITLTGDSLFTVTYSGVYLIKAEFVATRSGGASNEATIFLRDGSNANIANSGRSIQLENANIRYNFSYSTIVRLNAEGTFKLIAFYPQTFLRFLPTTSDATTGKALTPCCRLSVVKISDQ